MANTAIQTLDPMRIKKIGNRTVRKSFTLGDGFVGFLMGTVEDGASEISCPHFQATIHDIALFLKEMDFKTVPRDSLDILQERIERHHVPVVDMIIPFRIPPDRGNYLKWNSHKRMYNKQPLVIDRLHVEGENFMVVAMDPMWEPGE